MKHRFTKEKFLALPDAQQHKKCCEMLKHAYEIQDACLIGHYNDMQQWLGLPLLITNNVKTLSDRFHWHLHKAHLRIKEHNLLPNVTIHDGITCKQELPIAIYMDHIRSAHNIGSIIRTTEALRLGTLYFSDQMAFVDHKQVRDTAMTCEQWVQCSRGSSLKELPKPLICLETSPDAVNLYDFIFPSSFTLIVGNEEYGCSDEALSQADHLVQIPMHGRKNSLNVANAFAITAAEIRRQEHLKNTRELLW